MPESRNSAFSVSIAALFFLSGSAGLVYEVVWTRVFADIVGSTALSMTAVFSVFLLALATGAHLFGRVTVSGARALRLYGLLEVAIALSALASSAALIGGRSWIAVRLPAGEPFALTLLGHLLATSVLIGVPATLMGGTLPVILNASRGWTSPRKIVTLLYGWNTLGAACGALAAGCFLIWHLGLGRTLGVAVALNLAAGAGALLVASRLKARHRPASIARAEETGSPARSADAALWLGLAFFSGFGVLAYEILWGRMARFLLGDRTVAIAVLLFVFICCLGLGSLVAPRVGRRFGRDSRASLSLVAAVMLLGSLLHLAMVPLARRTIEGQGLAALVHLPSEFWNRVLIVALLISPPLLVLGLVFPLLAWSARRIDLDPGRVIGNLYFVNTAGAVLGAAVASFALSRWLGTLGGFLALTGLLVAGTVTLILLRAAGRGLRAAALAAVIVFALAAIGFPGDMVRLRADETLVAANEDEYGVQVLARTDRGTLRVRNNRLSLIYDLGEWQTSHAHQMAAHMTVLLAGDCRDVLNVGTGYGITAGAFALYDVIESIETVEILPFLVEHQPHFAPFNFDYVSDPRVRLSQGDGRHYLVTSPRNYDIISVNVLDPYLPGSSSLFTVDFWELARSRLRPGGVYTAQLWGVDLELLSRGMREVFPTVLYFPAYGGTCVQRDRLPRRDGGRRDPAPRRAARPRRDDRAAPVARSRSGGSVAGRTRRGHRLPPGLRKPRRQRDRATAHRRFSRPGVPLDPRGGMGLDSRLASGGGGVRSNDEQAAAWNPRTADPPGSPSGLRHPPRGRPPRGAGRAGRAGAGSRSGDRAGPFAGRRVARLHRRPATLSPTCGGRHRRPLHPGGALVLVAR